MVKALGYTIMMCGLVGGSFVANVQTARAQPPQPSSPPQPPQPPLPPQPPSQTQQVPPVATQEPPTSPLENVVDDLRPIRLLKADISLPVKNEDDDPLQIPQGVAESRFPKTVIVQPLGFSRSNLIGMDVHGLDLWSWEGTCFLWDAPGLCHPAVHFEETYAERCGQTWGFSQPLFSVMHYYGTMPTLPYRLVAHPPKECQYTLGECRPDNCSPFYMYRLPRWSAKAALATAAFYTGMNYVIP